MHYCRVIVALRDRTRLWRTILLMGTLVLARAQSARADATNAAPSDPAARAGRIYEAAKSAYHAQPAEPEAIWHFARACFDRAEFASNNTQRAALAEEGIAASRALIAQNSNAVAGPYYLGMNLGQLARTKTLGALPVVDDMEVEFKAARVLDEHFDFAGPDRNLGLLYFEAPVLASIGSRSKARQHLKRALELAPEYPENRLNWIEACLKYGETATARKELAALDAAWEQARQQFAGDAWTAAWADWTARREKCHQRLEAEAHTTTSPRGFP
jgi:tetratricopeptide (TPR) repeat protein